jgi:hypothetical protein
VFSHQQLLSDRPCSGSLLPPGHGSRGVTCPSAHFRLLPADRTTGVFPHRFALIATLGTCVLFAQKKQHFFAPRVCLCPPLSASFIGSLDPLGNGACRHEDTVGLCLVCHSEHFCHRMSSWWSSLLCVSAAIVLTSLQTSATSYAGNFTGLLRYHRVHSTARTQLSVRDWGCDSSAVQPWSGLFESDYTYPADALASAHAASITRRCL